jgi:stress-induced morphogen/rhodanese-related sulfurtransferase
MEEPMSLVEIGPSSTMEEILHAYPSAKVGLFQRYHIGGCASCGYQSADTLAAVCQTHNITDSIDDVIVCIRGSREVEARLHIQPVEVAAVLKRGELVQLLDVRSPQEWEVAHIPGAQLLTVELTFEALDSWPKDTLVVVYSNQGRRSLEKASYFRAYGLTNVKSMDGGLEAWTKEIGLPGVGLGIRDRIAKILRHDLAAIALEVNDESALHVGHVGGASGGGHYRVTIVSPLFASKNPVERHHMVYAALAAEMQQAIHSLVLTTLAPGEQVPHAAKAHCA